MAEGSEGRRPRMPLHRQIAFGFCALLFLLGILFTPLWGIFTGVWLDNGVYSVAITLVGFGLAGMWLVYPDPVVVEGSPGSKA